MDNEQLLAAEEASPLGRSRADVLDLLRTADGPLGVREVAQRTGLHPNTARFHLEALVDAGLADRQAEDREAPGRPRIGYRAVADSPAGRRRYRLLAEMLTSLIAGTMAEPGTAAEEAGREWGAYLTQPPPPYQRLTAQESLAKLTEIMTDFGFAPQPAADGGRYRLCLHQCPFREVAERHRDVICALHLGLMRGALATMRAPLRADRLDPFVEPGLCVAWLTAAGPAGQREPHQRYVKQRTASGGPRSRPPALSAGASSATAVHPQNADGKHAPDVRKRHTLQTLRADGGAPGPASRQTGQMGRRGPRRPPLG